MATISRPDDPHGPHSPRRFIKRMTEKVDFGEDVDFVVGATATALTADQLLKQSTCKEHKVMHLAKASLGAAVAATAFTMMSREHDQRRHEDQHNKHHGGRGLRRQSHHTIEEKDWDSDSSSDHHIWSRSRQRHHLLPGARERLYHEEDWAVVRSRSPAARSASASGDYYTRRNTDYNEDPNRAYDDYYDQDYRREGRSRSRPRRSYDLPYPTDTPPRQRSMLPRTEMRSRSYSPPRHRSRDGLNDGGGGGGFKKFFDTIQEGIETYGRYQKMRE